MESLHYSIRAGPGATKFGRSPWRRVGGMEHHLIARLEGGAVRLSVVGLMALGRVEVVASNFLGEASLLYELCNELRGLDCGLWNTGELEVEGKAEFSAKHHEGGSETGGLVHCGPVGEEGPGNKVIPNIVVGVVHESLDKCEKRTVGAFRLTVTLGVVRNCAGLV